MRFVKHLGSVTLTVAATMLLGTLSACSEPAAPDSAAVKQIVSADASPSLLSTSPTILHFRRGAPPLEETSLSFYAKKGQSKTVSLHYRAPNGSRAAEYSRLVIPSDALLQRPDGRFIAWGDSVLITISAPDPSLLLLRMEPHGLRFDPRSPARLTMRYDQADRDLNGDGVVNLIDTVLELRLAIWRQPTLFDLFTRLTSLLDRSTASVSADLPGFSQYIIAY
jgi:hypothetical protein